MDKEKTRHRSVVSKNSSPTERWRGKTQNYPKYSQERIKIFSSTFSTLHDFPYSHRHIQISSACNHMKMENQNSRTRWRTEGLKNCMVSKINWENLDVRSAEGLFAFGKLGKFIVKLTQTIESAQSVSSVRFVFGKHEFTHYYVHTSLSSLNHPTVHNLFDNTKRAVNKRKFSTSSCSFYLSVSAFLIFSPLKFQFSHNFHIFVVGTQCCYWCE